jgi:hypothetical protein
MSVASVASVRFKSRSAVASPSSPSAASPWCLLLAFCCHASFSDCGGCVTEAGEWRCRCEHTLSPSLLRGKGRDTVSSFCYREQHEIRLPLLGPTPVNSWWNRLTVGWWELRPDASWAPGASISDLIACHIINLGDEPNELSHKNTFDIYPLASLYTQHKTFASIRDYENVIQLPKQGEN